MDTPVDLRLRHLVYFALAHISTIVALSFWIGVAYNRLAGVEQRTSDNAVVIRSIMDSGTPANRIEFQMLETQLKEMDERLIRIERNTR